MGNVQFLETSLVPRTFGDDVFLFPWEEDKDTAKCLTLCGMDPMMLCFMVLSFHRATHKDL